MCIAILILYEAQVLLYLVILCSNHISVQPAVTGLPTVVLCVPIATWTKIKITEM